MLTLQERGAGLEQIEKMMDLLERNERHEAEKAYNEALAAFKAKNIRIVKRKLVDFPSKGGRTSYKHAELDDVVQAVGPELSDHGFAWSWKTHQAGRDITVVCTLRHRLGHAESVQLTAQPDETGGKTPSRPSFPPRPTCSGTRSSRSLAWPKPARMTTARAARWRPHRTGPGLGGLHQERAWNGPVRQGLS